LATNKLLFLLELKQEFLKQYRGLEAKRSISSIRMIGTQKSHSVMPIDLYRAMWKSIAHRVSIAFTLLSRGGDCPAQTIDSITPGCDKEDRPIGSRAQRASPGAGQLSLSSAAQISCGLFCTAALILLFSAST